MYQSERWMLWLTGAIAFFGLCTVGAALMQWSVMGGQLAEMKSGAKDTHDLATAAVDQAGAAKIQAEQAKIQSDRLSASVTEMQKESSAMRDAADASIAANRAWIVPVPMTSTQVEPWDRPVNLHWLNAGKSPAVNVYGTAEYEVGRLPVRTVKFSEGCKDLKQRLKGGMWEIKTSLVLPGSPFDFTLGNTPAEWGSTQAAQIVVLVAHGCIWYTDVLSNRERTTEFCYEANKVPLGSTPQIAVYPCWTLRRNPLSFH